MVMENDKLSLEWKAEIDRRWKNYKVGRTVAFDGEEVERRLANKYNLRLPGDV